MLQPLPNLTLNATVFALFMSGYEGQHDLAIKLYGKDTEANCAKVMAIVRDEQANFLARAGAA